MLQAIGQLAAHAFERARLYDALQKHKEELEHAVERARVADRRKDEFLAMLGHELRNPLAPIVTALQLMELQGASDARAGARGDRAAGRAPVAAGRRPARRLAHHARQDRAAQRVRRARPT